MQKKRTKKICTGNSPNKYTQMATKHAQQKQNDGSNERTDKKGWEYVKKISTFMHCSCECKMGQTWWKHFKSCLKS